MNATATNGNDHVPGFGGLPEDSRLRHLIEHGHWLSSLRKLSADELTMLHTAIHANGGQITGQPDIPALADKAVQMAAAMREHLDAGRWSEAYACADWLIDLADEIHSHVWAAHPEARPETW